MCYGNNFLSLNVILEVHTTKVCRIFSNKKDRRLSDKRFLNTEKLL